MAVFTSLFVALAETLMFVLDLYIFVLIAGAVLSWLAAFDVINTHNKFVRAVGELSFRLTEPALRPIRRFLPAFGNIDLSPLALIVAILFVQTFVRSLVASL